MSTIDKAAQAIEHVLSRHGEHGTYLDAARALDAADLLASAAPSVEIESRLGQPDTCVVTHRGVIVFDGVGRSALLRTKSAAAHDAAVAARALREAANEVAYAVDWWDAPESVESWLHERADRIEREGGESDA